MTVTSRFGRSFTHREPRRAGSYLLVGMVVLGAMLGCGAIGGTGGGGGDAAADADGQQGGVEPGAGVIPAAGGQNPQLPPGGGPAQTPAPEPPAPPPADPGAGGPEPAGGTPPAGGGEESLVPGLVAGDRYDIVSERAAADQLGQDIWAVLHESANLCWQSRDNYIQQYQFYEDPSFAQGPLMRYNGIDVIAGPMAVHSVGWYYLPDRTEPYMAGLVNTWQDGWELIIIEDNDTMVHTWWTNGGSPFVTYYDGSDSNCL